MLIPQPQILVQKQPTAPKVLSAKVDTVQNAQATVTATPVITAIERYAYPVVNPIQIVLQKEDYAKVVDVQIVVKIAIAVMDDSARSNFAMINAKVISIAPPNRNAMKMVIASKEEPVPKMKSAKKASIASNLSVPDEVNSVPLAKEPATAIRDKTA